MHTPMDYFSQQYFNIKNGVIKAERRILKELGFCVHVKHPHKLIITYLQMIEHQNNVSLARKAWNYMNDSLRSDVFVRFAPETIACACIFLAARTTQVNLPQRPPWYELFDATFDDIEDVALTILRLYARPRRKISHLEAIVHKIKKRKAEQEKAAAALKNVDGKKAGSFTPSHNDDSNASAPNPAILALNNNNSSKPNSKPTSRTASPVDKPEKKTTLNSVISTKNSNDDNKRNSRNRHRSESEESSEYSSDSGTEVSSKKYSRDRKQYERNKKRRSPSSDSENDRRIVSKIRRSVSPDDRRSKYKDSSRDKVKLKQESNGQYDKSYSRTKKRSRSRSPVKRSGGRSPSPPSRKDKYYSREKDREREKIRSKDKSYDKYSSKSRR